MFFSRFEYHMLYVLYPFVTHLLTLPRMSRAASYYIDHYSLPFRHSRLYSRSFLRASLNKPQRRVHIRTGCLGEYVTLSGGIDERVDGII
jgi:hypothetical protein